MAEKEESRAKDIKQIIWAGIMICLKKMFLTDYQYDIFISCNQQNTLEFLEKLKNFMHTPLEREPKLFTSSLYDKKVKDAIKSSYIFLIIISKDYITSEECKKQRKLFLKIIKGLPKYQESRIVIVEAEKIEHKQKILERGEFASYKINEDCDEIFNNLSEDLSKRLKNTYQISKWLNKRTLFFIANIITVILIISVSICLSKIMLLWMLLPVALISLVNETVILENILWIRYGDIICASIIILIGIVCYWLYIILSFELTLYLDGNRQQNVEIILSDSKKQTNSDGVCSFPKPYYEQKLPSIEIIINKETYKRILNTSELDKIEKERRMEIKIVNVSEIQGEWKNCKTTDKDYSAVTKEDFEELPYHDFSLSITKNDNASNEVKIKGTVSSIWEKSLKDDKSIFFYDRNFKNENKPYIIITPYCTPDIIVLTFEDNKKLFCWRASP